MGDGAVPSIIVRGNREPGRTGFRDSARAQELLASVCLTNLESLDSALLEELLIATADPDLALSQLVRILDSAPAELRNRLARTWSADSDSLGRVIDVLGLSHAFGDFLHRHPEAAEVLLDGQALTVPTPAAVLRAEMLAAVGARAQDEEPVATVELVEGLDAIRVQYRTLLLGIASRDLSGLIELPRVMEALSDLADATLEAALALARHEFAHDATRTNLAIIGMGKCGARELNYISDVDVIFVAEPKADQDEQDALRSATVLASAVMRYCSTPTAEGTIWEVDAALRPEGKQGALVRSLDSHLGYYQRWAKTWEFQALLKARFCAGDARLGAAYCDAVADLVWSAADRPGFVDDVQAMRRRVEEHIPAGVAEREIKLGPGGLRDIEFSVQLLQMVHGRSDVMLRSAATLPSLEGLATWGYVGRADASSLTEAYTFLRHLEHRLQLRHLRRTHTVPADEHEVRVVARSMGLRTDPLEEFRGQWKHHAREARRLHEKLFYRPLLQAVARLDAGEARLTVQAAEDRMRALGFANPAGALGHVTALTSGVSRRAAIQRTLLPVLLGWFADGPDPDAGLLGFRQVSDHLGSTPWYLRLLRDESTTAEHLAHILSSSRYATELLLRAPESVQVLANEDELPPRTRESLWAEVDAIVARHESAEAVVGAVRAMRRRELFRLAVAQILGRASAEQVGQGLTDVMEAVLHGGLSAAWIAECGDSEPLTELAIIAMGRFGGAELGFGSDADVLFVYAPRNGASDAEANAQAFAVVNRMRALLTGPSPDPAVEIDADLRPEGKNGPLVRSLDSYAAYYEKWSSPWEAQALLRARFAVGSSELGRAFIALIDPLRYPADGISADALREMRRLKARMESERLPRGAEPRLHTKQGPGGLADVEWVAQLLQMQHGSESPALQVAGTIPALEAAQSAGLISHSDTATLSEAWTLATAIRNAGMLARGRASDMVPAEPREASSVAFILGKGSGGGAELREEYLRVTRRARAVTERLFYGANERDM